MITQFRVGEPCYIKTINSHNALPVQNCLTSYKKMKIVLLFLYLTIVQSLQNDSTTDQLVETIFSSEEKTKDDDDYTEDNQSRTHDSKEDYFKIWSEETQTVISKYPNNERDYNNGQEYSKTEANFKVWSDTQTINSNIEENITNQTNETTNQENTTNKVIQNYLQQLLNIKPFVPPTNFIPPQFIMDLYHVVTDPQTGETIRDNPHDASEVWSILEEHPGTTGLFKFDLSDVTNDLIEAELHVYRIGLDIPVSVHHPPYYLLRVYQVIPTSTSSNYLTLNPDFHQLLNVHYVSAFGTGWQVFKIKRAVDAWRNGALNLGILITATTILNEPVDLRFARKGIHGDKYQPTLIIYNGKINQQILTMPMDLLRINKRSIEDHACLRRPLYVDFEQLGLNNVIIAPEGFESYQCVGVCDFPLQKQQNGNNHAIFQSVMKFLGATIFEPCCVPIQMKSVSILYITEKLYVKLVQFNNMIISNCGCR